MKKILLAITGSIAAVRSYELIRLFQERGVLVQCIVTEGGDQFISRLALESLSGYPVLGPDIFTFPDVVDPRKPLFEEVYAHIELSKTADAVLIAPASADAISEIAHGKASGFLNALVLASEKPLLLAPAMNSKMWNNVAVQSNISLLKQRGICIIDPQTDGVLACGEIGVGKMANPEDILLETFHHTASSVLRGKNVLINTGGTKEFLDPVRFIGNESSGLTGTILSELCTEKGAQTVRVVQGSVNHVHISRFPQVVSVDTAEQMKDEMNNSFEEIDIIIFSAAVADFSPEKISVEKIKKTDSLPAIALKKTVDIARFFAEKKRPHQIFIGFALETELDEFALKEIIREKAIRKKFDVVFGNTPKSFNASHTRFLVYFLEDNRFEEIEGDKREIFSEVLERVCVGRKKYTQSV